MPRQLSEAEFFEELQKRMTGKRKSEKLSVLTLKDVFKALATFAQEELWEYEIFRIPYLGTFKATSQGGKNMKVPNTKGIKDATKEKPQMMEIYVRRYLVPRFVVSETFVDNLNQNNPSTKEIVEAYVNHIETQKRLAERERRKEERQKKIEERVAREVENRQRRRENIEALREKRLRQLRGEPEPDNNNDDYGY